VAEDAEQAAVAVGPEHAINVIPGVIFLVRTDEIEHDLIAREYAYSLTLVMKKRMGTCSERLNANITGVRSTRRLLI